jgi:hypothetical protein
MEVVVEEFFDGLKLIRDQNKFDRSFYYDFGYNDDQERGDAKRFLSKIGRRNYLRNPDLFYSLLQYGAYREFQCGQAGLNYLRLLQPKEYLKRLLEGSFNKSTAIDSVYNILGGHIRKQMLFSDEELKRNAEDYFIVESTSLTSDEHPVIYSKINHGYWEFLLNGFADIDGDERYRDLSKSLLTKALKDSGFHAILFDAFKSLGVDGFDSPELKIGVSLTAGNIPHKETVATELTAGSRGALVGLSSLLSALENTSPIRLYEGAAPRDMIKDGTFKDFFDSQLNSFDAVLLLVPPGFKAMQFPKYRGRVHCVTVPAQVVHDTSRVLIPVIMSVVSKLSRKYERLCVITQSAVLAPLVAVYVYQLLKPGKNNVSFFDLGRVLDVTRPEVVSNYPSLSWVIRNKLHYEIMGYMKLETEQDPFGLCSLPDLGG